MRCGIRDRRETRRDQRRRGVVIVRENDSVRHRQSRRGRDKTTQTKKVPWTRRRVTAVRKFLFNITATCSIVFHQASGYSYTGDQHALGQSTPLLTRYSRPAKVSPSLASICEGASQLQLLSNEFQTPTSSATPSLSVLQHVSCSVKTT